MLWKQKQKQKQIRRIYEKNNDINKKGYSKMKTMILTLLISSSAHAGWAPRCWYIPSVPCEGFRSYCSHDELHKTGWTLLSDGTAVNFDSLAGASDPFTNYKIEVAAPGTFQINRYQKSTGQLIDSVGSITHISESAISFDGEILDEQSCD